jgi:hypothetical protein
MMSVKSCFIGLALAAVIALPTAGPVLAEGNIPEVGEVDQCLPLTRIKRTKAVDNQTIVVEMKGSDGWRKMETSARCPGLKFEDSFSYATSLAQLCKGDTITVLNGPGSRCGLAQITVVSEEDAKTMIANR